MLVNVFKTFDTCIKITFYYFANTIIQFFNTMDLLKIFRMSEPISKENLTKNASSSNTPRQQINSKNIQELEQEIINLKNTNMNLEQLINQIKANNGSLILDYEEFYMKIMTESEIILNENKQLQGKIDEMDKNHKNLLKLYRKSEETVKHYEGKYEELKQQITDYEKIIQNLSGECLNLKRQFQNACLGATTNENKTKMADNDDDKRFVLVVEEDRQQFENDRIKHLPKFVPY